MPKLVIDDCKVEVPLGTKVIEAAARVGIIIPRFCYHPSLGAVGACRVCAVKFVEGPVKGVEMSCMTDAEDGMVVSTTDDEAVDFRKHVVEWLMMNHPHDCPVCDEGGHCLLQDLTVAGGHGNRRFLGKKRTYLDQDLGPFVQHEMNRCIHCFRCRRFYQEFTGYRDLGVMQIGSRQYFGRFTDGLLESPFAGNLNDICPTGVFTDKPSRYKGRRWDFERGPSLCVHCSLGCLTVASARYREMVRIEARFSEKVNGYFICDRGRYGFAYSDHEGRPRRARIGKEEVPWDKAIEAAAKALSMICGRAGTQAIASLGSARSCLDTQGMLKRLCRVQGWPEPRYFVDPSIEGKVKKAVSRLDARLTASLREIELSDFALVVGVDPVNEAPMLALAMRQAYRKGATVAVMDPRPVSLPLPFEYLPLRPDDLEPCLGALVKGVLERAGVGELGPEALRIYDALPSYYPLEPMNEERTSRMVRALRESQRPVIICGTEIPRVSAPNLAADLVLLLQAVQKRARLFYLLPEANACGAALLSPSQGSFLETIEGMETGVVKALVVVENDPFCLFPDRGKLEKALSKLDFLIVLDHLPSDVGHYANVFLPTQTLFEAGGIFVNNEGRAQLAQPTHCGGLSIAQVGAGNHPPRTFSEQIPGGEPRPAWKVLLQLGETLSEEREWSIKALRADLAIANKALSSISDLATHPDGIRLIPDGEDGTAFSWPKMELEKKAHTDGLMELLLVGWTFGTEELSNYSRYIRKVEKAPCLLMHAADADELGLEAGDHVSLRLPGGALEIDLCLSEEMARGILVMPRHRKLAWQKLRQVPAMLARSDIKKWLK
jgi:NADH-quinone oxidoreductase subunit G